VIHLVHKDDVWDFNGVTIASDIIREFEKQGCKLHSETSFDASGHSLVNPEDSVLVHISLRNERNLQRLAQLPNHKVIWGVDESKPDRVLFRTERDYCKRLGFSTVITPFPSTRNVSSLTEDGINVISMMHSLHYHDFPRAFNKQYDVLVSGNLTPSYYPVRHKIANAILNSRKFKTGFIPFPGYSISQNPGQIMGGDYIRAASQCWIGITCKAGWCDRLLAKYIEFGKGCCLPIGDVPTFMPGPLEKEMLVITEDHTDTEIVRMVEEALNDKVSLTSRINRYRDYLEENHELTKRVSETITKIETRQFDFPKRET
jgi:hypothetical protein